MDKSSRSAKSPPTTSPSAASTASRSVSSPKTTSPKVTSNQNANSISKAAPAVPYKFKPTVPNKAPVTNTNAQSTLFPNKSASKITSESPKSIISKQKSAINSTYASEISSSQTRRSSTLSSDISKMPSKLTSNTKSNESNESHASIISRTQSDNTTGPGSAVKSNLRSSPSTPTFGSTVSTFSLNSNDKFSYEMQSLPEPPPQLFGVSKSNSQSHGETLNDSKSISIKRFLQKVSPNAGPSNDPVPLTISVTSHVTTRRKSRIHFDYTHLTSCTGFLSILTIFANIVIVLITVFAKRCTNLTKYETEILILPRQEQCPIADLFFVASSVSILFLTVFLISYMFRIVALTLDRIPWLCIEFTFYAIATLTYLALSIIVFTYINWFKLVGALGLFGMIIYLCLFLAKFAFYKLDVKAQTTEYDPYDDDERAKMPNKRFTDDFHKNYKDVKRVWKL